MRASMSSNLGYDLVVDKLTLETNNTLSHRFRKVVYLYAYDFDIYTNRSKCQRIVRFEER